MLQTEEACSYLPDVVMINAQKEWTTKETDEFQIRAQRGKSHWL
jgi:hypothetical protein